MTTTKSTARTLTVSGLYREWGQQHRKNQCIVPSIRLNGKWLATLGFVLGQKLSVVTNGTTITITRRVDGKDLGWPNTIDQMNKSTKIKEDCWAYRFVSHDREALNKPTRSDTER